MGTWTFETPLGWLSGARGPLGWTRLTLAEAPEAGARDGAETDLHLPLQRYLAGELEALVAVPLAPEGTEFQRAVWSALRAVPPGQPATYGALAARLGRPPGASRAVGAAVGSNPLAILVPCHRVLGAEGDLVGFRWGLERKRWLLAHEGWRDPASRQTTLFGDPAAR